MREHVSALVSPTPIAVKTFSSDASHLAVRNGGRRQRSRMLGQFRLKTTTSNRLGGARSHAARCETQNTIARNTALDRTEVKHFPPVSRHRAVVRMRRHQLARRRPPPTAEVGAGNRGRGAPTFPNALRITPCAGFDMLKQSSPKMAVTRRQDSDSRVSL